VFTNDKLSQTHFNVFLNFEPFFSYAYYTYFTVRNKIRIVRMVALWSTLLLERRDSYPARRRPCLCFCVCNPLEVAPTTLRLMLLLCSFDLRSAFPLCFRVCPVSLFHFQPKRNIFLLWPWTLTWPWPTNLTEIWLRWPSCQMSHSLRSKIIWSFCWSVTMWTQTDTDLLPHLGSWTTNSW